MRRISEINRQTKETEVKVSLNLDGEGIANINTGNGFFDHMLTQIAVHGCFNLEIVTKGDLHIDSHHTIEDTAIVFGKAIIEALGNKKGIFRVGSSFTPMDEALAFVALDLSGRPYWSFSLQWHGDYLGSGNSLIPVSLIEHFFQTLAVHAGITIHIKEETGKDNHHIAESIFKAFSRALDQASRLDEKRKLSLPSSKGILE